MEENHEQINKNRSARLVKPSEQEKKVFTDEDKATLRRLIVELIYAEPREKRAK